MRRFAAFASLSALLMAACATNGIRDLPDRTHGVRPTTWERYTVRIIETLYPRDASSIYVEVRETPDLANMLSSGPLGRMIVSPQIITDVRSRDEYIAIVAHEMGHHVLHRGTPGYAQWSWERIESAADTVAMDVYPPAACALLDMLRRNNPQDPPEVLAARIATVEQRCTR